MPSLTGVGFESVSAVDLLVPSSLETETYSALFINCIDRNAYVAPGDLILVGLVARQSSRPPPDGTSNVRKVAACVDL